MLGPASGLVLRKYFAQYFRFGQGTKRQWRNESSGVVGHNNSNFGSVLFEDADKFGGLVCCYTAADTYDDLPAGDMLKLFAHPSNLPI